MKVLYIHQYFRTPSQGGSVRSYNLAKELVANGIDVEVITAHNFSTNKTEVMDGIKVHYLAIPYDNKFGYLKRVWAFAKFVIFTIVKSHQIKQVDICYIMTTPLTTGLIGLYNKWMRAIPYIFEVGDLWPEVPIRLGIINNPILKWILYKLEKLFYQQAKGVVALSSDIASYIKNIVPNKPIEIIPNIADCDFFDANIKDDKLKLNYGLNDELVISYTGTLGRANHLEYLLDAAKATEYLSIKYLIVGDGSEKSRLVAYAKKSQLKNVAFHPVTDKQGVKDILNISDAIYLSFQNIEILHTGSPNKLFDGMAAGKVIISNLKGWTKELIEDNGLGICYPPENTNELVEKMEVLMENEDHITTCKKNARILAGKKFSLKILSERQLTYMKSLIKMK